MGTKNKNNDLGGPTPLTSFREEEVYFRIVGVASDQLSILRHHLGDVKIEYRQRKGMDDFVLSVELSTSAVCDVVREALSSVSLNAPYGLYVSLTTMHDSDGISLEPFICEFWKAVGGSLDFSFTVVE